MADKTLATFRIDPQEWEAFKNMAAASGSNASAVLTEFVRSYLAPNSQSPHLDNLDTAIDERLDKVLDDRGLKPEIIKEQLEQHTAYLASGLNATMSELRSQLEELRGKLPA